MVRFGGIHGDHLRQLIERIEVLEEEKKQVSETIRDIYSESKAHGFDPKIMRQIVRLRKMDHSDREQQEHILDTYKAALGMIPEFAANDEAAALEGDTSSEQAA